MDTENIDKALLGFDDESESSELAGLGAAIGIKFNQLHRVAANKFAAAKTAKALIQSNLTKGQTLLTAQSQNLEIETRKNWAAGKIMFADVVKYIRRPITNAAGMVDLFQDIVAKEVGISNISKGRLDDGENLMLERIELEYDMPVTVINDVDPYSATIKKSDFAPISILTTDPALMNGELEVVIGGRSMLRIPVASICEPKKDVVGSLANGFNFKAPKLIKEKEEIQVRIHFAGAMVATALHSQVVTVKFIGDSTKLR